MDWKSEMIEAIKDCGNSLINNAEKILNDFEYQKDIDICCHIPCNGVASIEIITEYIPAEYIKRKFNIGDNK